MRSSVRGIGEAASSSSRKSLEAAGGWGREIEMSSSSVMPIEKPSKRVASVYSFALLRSVLEVAILCWREREKTASLVAVQFFYSDNDKHSH